LAIEEDELNLCGRQTMFRDVGRIAGIVFRFVSIDQGIP
jgi:hypothetical protein